MNEIIEDQSLVSSDGSLAGARDTSQTLPDAEYSDWWYSTRVIELSADVLQCLDGLMLRINVMTS